ncbi:MAG TPA: histidine kinase dimerization/phospho-acceptor domain-containing protein [Pseudolabrys sp.]
MAKRKRKSRPGKRPRAPSPVSSRASAINARKAHMRAIEAALAGIAHDIRTPLTGIVALAELLASSDLAAREREWANAIKSGADHLAALATLIVDAAKVGASGLILRNEPFAPCACRDCRRGPCRARR